MELDLLLARQLQAEENHHAAAAQQQSGSSEEAVFIAKLQSGVQMVLKVTQDALLQAPPAPAGAMTGLVWLACSTKTSWYRPCA